MNFANGGQSTLSAAVTAGDTTLTVANGAVFPAAPFHLAVDTELMTCTAALGGLLTVTRGIEGTTAAAHASGALVTNTVTAGDFAGFLTSASGVTSFNTRTGAVTLTKADVDGVFAGGAAWLAQANIFTATGGVVATGGFTSTANNAPAGVYIGVGALTPRIQFCDGTHNFTIDNNSGDVRWIVDGNVKFGLIASTTTMTFTVNLSVGFDTAGTAPPYSARVWIYGNVGAGTAQENPSLVVEQNTNGTPAAGFGGGMVFRGKSSTTSSRLMAEDAFVWVVSTDAVRTARRTFGVHDSATAQGSPREVIRMESDGAAGRLAFFGGAAVVKQANASQATINLIIDPNAAAALQSIYNLLLAYALAPATA